MIKALIRICCIGDPKPSKQSCPCPTPKTRKCHESATVTGMCMDEEADDRKKDKMLVIVISKMAKKGVYMSAVRMDEYCPGGSEVLDEVGRRIADQQVRSQDKDSRRTQKYKYQKEQGSTQKWKYKDKPSAPSGPPVGRRSPPPENKNPNIDSQPRVDSRTGLTFQQKQDMVSKVYEQPQFPQTYY